MTIEIQLESGKQVKAVFADGLTMLTDQPVEQGGEGMAPSPFACFLGAIGTCAGFFVQEFCAARNIPTDAVTLTQQAGFELDGQGKKRLSRLSITINLPSTFPEKYRDAVVRAANLCSVKKAILTPPEFSIDFKVA